MNNEILFGERQKFKQWWLWIILLGINGLFLLGVFKQVIEGTAFNVSGNKGLQLEFTNDKKLLIGTKKADELTEVLNKIGQLK